MAACLLLQTWQTAHAQNPAKIMAPYYLNENGLTYTALPVVVGSTAPENGYMAGLKAQHSQNIQMDPLTGKILFFIVDDYIFDRKGRFLGHVSAGSKGIVGESVIVPGTVCNNTNVFFIFSTYSDPSGPTYTSLGSYDKITIAYDSQDNLIAGSSVLSNTETTSFLFFETLIGSDYTNYNSGGGHCHRTTLAVTKELSGNKRFLYVQNNKRIFRMKIENDLFSYDNYYIDLDPYFSPGLVSCPDGKSEMEIVTKSNGDLRLAFPIQTGSVKGYGTLDFYGVTAPGITLGNVIPSSAKNIGYSSSLIGSSTFFVKGAELSPNGERLYLTHDPIPVHYPSTVDMFNLTSSTPFSTRYAVSTDVKFKSSQIETSSDGTSLLIPEANALYKIAASNGPALPALTSYFPFPSTYSTACGSCPYSQQVLLLQDQVDGENYANYGIYSYSDDSYTVTTSATWTSGAGNNPFNATTNIYIKDELRIQYGVNLTVTGLNIHFGPNAKLIIENGFSFGTIVIQGGKLTLNNTTLTADSQGCDAGNEMWYGVEVWGNGYLPQGTITTSYQGRLIMNNSRIEHAYVGASARRMTGSTPETGNYGGIIQATNSTFYNNQNDVIIANFIAGNNVSRFLKTSFVTEGLLRIPSLPLGVHMTLDYIKGMYITGCTFTNINPYFYGTVDKQGIGIRGINAQFFLDAGCSLSYPMVCFTPDVPNTFTNLTRGIDYSTTLSTMTFSCDGSVFNNNILGISASGAQNMSIIRNTFNVMEISPSTPVINQSAGISMTGCTAYQIEENTFQEQDDPILFGGGNSYGIVVKSSGINPNQIYRNKFSTLKIGGQSELINGGLYSEGDGQGLVWKCNQFNGRIYSYDLAIASGIIGHHQGYPFVGGTITDVRKAAANNKFSRNNEPMTNTHDFFVSSSSVPNSVYHDYLNHDFYDLDSYSSAGMSVTHAMHSGSYITFDPTGCPSNLDYGFVFLQPAEEQSQSSSNDLSGKSMPEEATENPIYKHHLEKQAAEERQANVRRILMDTSINNTNEVLVDYLSTLDDRESQKMLAEIIFLQGGEINALMSEKIGDDFMKLLHAKKIFMNDAERISVRPSLIEISTSEDILIAEQARIMLSLLEPYNPVHRFEEIECEGAMENEKIASTKFIEVYPNPATEKLTFKVEIAEVDVLTANIYSVLGSEIATWKLNAGQKTFDVSTFTPGIYIINLMNENGSLVETLKFIKD